MKFNCGPSADERRRARREAQDKEQRRRQNWHEWFAWFPVRVGSGDCRWLETIYRKEEWRRMYYASDSYKVVTYMASDDPRAAGLISHL